MRSIPNITRRISFSILFSLLTLASFAQKTHAQVLIPDGELPADQSISDDAIVFGEIVRVDGNVDGDLLAIGTDVQINGNVTGSLLLLGRELVVNGDVGGSVYSLGGTLVMGPESTTRRNVYFGGLRLATETGSQITRDLVTAALKGKLSGHVGRNLRSVIGLLEIADILRQGVENEINLEESPAPTIVPQQDQSQGSSLTDPAVGFIHKSFINNRFISRSVLQNFSTQEEYRSSFAKKAAQTIQSNLILNWFQNRLTQFINYLIVGLLLIWLFPYRLDECVKALLSKPLQSAGYGFLGLVIALNGYVILVILAVILLAFGLGLGYASLWSLAYYLWGIGYSSLVLLFFLYSAFVFYISKVIVAYLGGYLILSRLSPKSITHKVLPLILGLLIYSLLLAIPYLGWVFGILGIVLGLGSTWLAFRNRGNLSSGVTQMSES